MPPVKKATRRAPKKATSRTTKRPPQRKMSAAHKKALAEGRAMSATVDRYLDAVNTPKQRGRKVSAATLTQRLAAAKAGVKTARGVDRVMAAQTVRDLEKRIAQLNATNAVDIKALEAAFIRVAKKFSQNRGIGYGAWRDAGVPASVLQRAGVARTRS